MSARTVKHWSTHLAEATLCALVAVVSCSSGVAAQPEQAGASPAGIAKLEETLRQVGASPAEIAKLEEILIQHDTSDADIEDIRKESPAELTDSLALVRLMVREEAQHPTLKIGATLPDFALKGVDGKIHTPADYKASPVFVVMFISNHCPTSQMYEGRIKKLVEDYATKGVAFVAIESNGVKGMVLSELSYTDVDDSFDGMVVRATYRKFPFPYLYDGDEQAAANKFGPKATPHIFIFDKNRTLRFEGRIDNNFRESKATTHDTRDAIEAVLAGRQVAVEHTSVLGCDTKWNSRMDNVQRELKEWQAKPVAVETVTSDGLKQLRRNPTRKMLMINFWATWCGPCVTELPDLLTTYQWYRTRGFDFVSVSVDSPDNRARVLAFLKSVHSPIRNLVVDSDDLYRIQAAFDTTWESGVPFTIVLAPDAKVVYRHEGAVDILTLRRAILASFTVAPEFGSAGNAYNYWKR